VSLVVGFTEPDEADSYDKEQPLASGKKILTDPMEA
jgi:hypothetical protein